MLSVSVSEKTLTTTTIYIIYVGPHVGTGPVLELGPIFCPVLELGRGHPHTGTPCLKVIWCQSGDKP